MTNYINTSTLQYPVSERDIRNAFPNTSFSNPFKAPEEYQVVFPIPQTVFNPVVQTVREIAPVLTDKGTYEQQWEVISKFQEYTDEQDVVHTVQEQEDAALAANLSSAKESKWNNIKDYRNKLTQEGGYKASNKWFHSDVFSRSQQLGLVMLGNSIPAGLMWKTMDGSFVEMTPTLAQEVFQSATLQDSAIFAYAENLNQQIQNSSDPEFIQGFDIKSGWPETYQQ